MTTNNCSSAARQAQECANDQLGWPRQARFKIALAAERSTPKMHWRWCRRGRDIIALLQSRFGSVLPEDDAGADAAELLAEHYMRLHIDAERVVSANLHLWSPWLAGKAFASIIKTAKKAKNNRPPSAATLGREWRVTVNEVAALGLTTIQAFTVTLENDRIRQARRRRNLGARNVGASQKRGRGRPSLELSPEDRLKRRKAQEAKRARRYRASRKNESRAILSRGMKRDGIKRDGISVSPAKPIVINLTGGINMRLLAIAWKAGTDSAVAHRRGGA